jgi:hypothetical protein
MLLLLLLLLLAADCLPSTPCLAVHLRSSLFRVDLRTTSTTTTTKAKATIFCCTQLSFSSPSRSLARSLRNRTFLGAVVVCSPNLLLRSHFALILAMIEEKLCLSSRSMFRHSEHRVGMSSTRELFLEARLLMGGDLVTQSVVSI